MSDLAMILRAYKNHKIAIYGLSVETEKVLHELAPEIHVTGLLDGYRTEGVLYDKPVITIEQAIKMQVKLILVVARPGSCKAIAKRIAKICMENRIDLLDIRGNNLCNIKKISYDFRNVNGITKQELVEIISEKDVISFDLFDTLIMRRTMFSTDVLELVDYELRERGVRIPQFQEKRLFCEKKLSEYAAPTLTEIYTYMKTIYKIADMNPGKTAELEWEIDCKLIVPRKDVCNLILVAERLGKKVYIVSDSYYTRQQLIKMLNHCGVKNYSDLLVSCEYHTGKTQNLFEKLKEKAGSQSCVHIGDDEIADIESAQKNGIDACYLHSGIDLLEASGYMGMWDKIETLSDRIRVGMFTAKIFNSPFQFESNEKRICVDNAYDTGYLFFAPVISDFTVWLQEKIYEYGLQNVLFCSRDGYLIKKLYDELTDHVSSVYFLTSREAALRAGIENMDDIMYVEQMKFSGSLQKQLEERFGVFVDWEDTVSHNSLLNYSKTLLDKAAKCREGYKKYINRLNIQEGGIAFFDFVAKGTTQMYMERFLENRLKGLYFLRLEDEYIKEKGLDVEAFYKADERNRSAIFEDYYILETVLTAPEPSVKEIDTEGVPVYAEETRTDENINCFLTVQEGIQEYFKTYLELCPESLREINKELDERMLSLIHGIAIVDKKFLNLKVEDPFFNRTTPVMDLI